MKRTRCNAGYTLIEVLLAMTILSIGLLSVAGMQITALQGGTRANSLTANVAIASGILENLLALEADDPKVFDPINPIVNKGWDFDLETVGDQLTTTIEGGGTYSATYTVDLDYDSGAGSIDNISRIQVTVTQVDGLQRTITLAGFKRSI